MIISLVGYGNSLKAEISFVRLYIELKQAFLTLGEPLKEDEVDKLLDEYSKGSMVDYKKLISALVGK